MDASIMAGTVEIYHPDTLERVRLPVWGDTGVDRARVGAFPSRTLANDFRKIDHEWLSAYAQSSWTGGGQLTTAREATQTDRYHGIASLDTRWPEQLTLLPWSEALAGPSGVTRALVLGDYDDGDPVRCFVAFDTTIMEVAGTDLFGSWELAAPPRHHTARMRIDNRDVLFVPVSGGWQEFDILSLSELRTTFNPLAFLSFDNKLWALDVDGWIWRNGTGAVADWSRVIQIRDGSRPRHLARFRNASGDPAILVITNKGALALDPSVPALYETDATFPGHPDAGLASSRWRQELHIAYGMDLGIYTLSTWTFRGLVRDQGVPAAYKGAIVSLADGFNDLFLLVNGQAQATTSDDVWSPTIEGELIWPTLAAQSYIMRQNGDGGFHTTWLAPALGDLATNVVVSENNDGYWLYWGWNGQIWAQRLSRQFLNPIDNDEAAFMPSGELISPWLNLNSDALRYLLAAVEVIARGLSATETVTVSYQLNSGEDDGAWTALATLDGETAPDELGIVRERIAPVLTMPDGTIHYAGEVFTQIRYKVALARDPDDRTVTPKTESVGFTYMPMMGDLKSFTLEIDCSSAEFDSRDYGLTNAERRAFLDRLPRDVFLGFSYGGGEWTSVKCTGVSGVDATGQDLRGNRHVSFIAAYSTTA